MRAVRSLPAGIVDDLVAVAAMPLDDGIELKFGSPKRRLRLYFRGDALGRCIFRQSSHHILSPSIYIIVWMYLH